MSKRSSPNASPVLSSSLSTAFHPDDIQAANEYAEAYRTQYSLTEASLVKAIARQHLVFLTNERTYREALVGLSAAQQRRLKILRACRLTALGDLTTKKERARLLAEVESIKQEYGIKNLGDVAEFVVDTWVIKE